MTIGADASASSPGTFSLAGRTGMRRPGSGACVSLNGFSLPTSGRLGRLSDEQPASAQRAQPYEGKRAMHGAGPNHPDLLYLPPCAGASAGGVDVCSLAGVCGAVAAGAAADFPASAEAIAAKISWMRSRAARGVSGSASSGVNCARASSNFPALKAAVPSSLTSLKAPGRRTLCHRLEPILKLGKVGLPEAQRSGLQQGEGFDVRIGRGAGCERFEHRQRILGAIGLEVDAGQLQLGQRRVTRVPACQKLR